MSTGAHSSGSSWPRWWVAWFLVGLVAIAASVLEQPSASTACSFRARRGGRGRRSRAWCKGSSARCGTFVVPEDRAEANGHTIGLRVVVLPALVKPARRDAVAYLAGGPGDAATEVALAGAWQSSQLRTYRDLLLVDQRGTGGSTPHGGDVTQYGTRTAMDDLDAVRAALGYRQLDVYGGSYGATAAQVYMKFHPSRVRTLILSGASVLDVIYFDRYAVNNQRALDQLATLCASEPACRKAFPGWERQFGALVKAWNAQPVHGMSGDQLASVVHWMLRDVNTAVSIPLVVSRAAKGDYGPLEHADSGDLDIGDLNLMGASIWCSEPWAGLDAKGPWGTDFDSYTTALIANFRRGVQLRPEARRASLALDTPDCPAARQSSRSSAGPTRRIRSQTSQT